MKHWRGRVSPAQGSHRVVNHDYEERSPRLCFNRLSENGGLYVSRGDVPRDDHNSNVDGIIATEKGQRILCQPSIACTISQCVFPGETV